MRARNVRAPAIVLAVALSSVRCGLTHDVDSLSSQSGDQPDASTSPEADAAQESPPPIDVVPEPQDQQSEETAGEPCGTLGLACCEAGAACGNGLTCDQGKCGCGLVNQPCCGGNVCADGGLCVGGTCKSCGHLGEICCGNSPVCNTDVARCCGPAGTGHCGSGTDGALCKVCCAVCKGGASSPAISAASTNYDCDEKAREWCKGKCSSEPCHNVDLSGWWDGC